MSLFTLRGELTKTQSIVLGLAGFVLFILAWWILAELLSVQRPIVEFDDHPPSSLDSTDVFINQDSLARLDSIAFANATEFEKVYPILPTPMGVVKSYPSLIQDDNLAGNTFHSIWLNLQGYFWAIVLCIPIGFLIGLIPLFQGLFSKQVDALRYLPLTALTGLFIIWFGIDDKMKVAFLAFGILVYLLPVVVQRINEVDDVYLKTVFTLGASPWETIRSVYMPSVFSKLIDDIRVLTAISWTYIIIAELVNRQGGIGALIYLKSRQGYMEKVFAILIVIVIIGFIQDRLFIYLDRRLFPHKFYKTTLTGLKEVEYGIFAMFGVIAVAVLLPIIWGGYPLALNNLAFIVLIAALVIVIYGEFRLRQSLVK